MASQDEPPTTLGTAVKGISTSYVELISSVLTIGCALLSVLAMSDLAVRAAVRLELRWDTFWYHLPFAALRGGLHIPYEMNESRRAFYQGFPPLPHLVQGILWRLTGSVNATGVVNYLAFVAFLSYCHFALRAKFWLVSLIALSAPLVIIHAAVSYVDLFGNSLLAIGISSCLYLYLFPERPSRLVFAGGLCGLAGAAWSKYLLVPVAGLGFCLLALVWMSRWRKTRFNWRPSALIILAAALVAAAPYLKNLALYGNPFWPLQMPVMAYMFPYEVATAAATRDRPPPLRESSQPAVFVHSLLEIDHPASYHDRPRWIIDQGEAWVAYRAGGFWVVGVVTYLLAAMAMLFVNHRKSGLVASLGMAGMLGFVAVLPQSNELRYYLFLPLCWASAIGMQYPKLREQAPRSALALLAVVGCLFLYMVSENRMHYRIEKMDWTGAAHLAGASDWWSKLQHGQTYCVVDMVPMGMLMTGPTQSEYTIIDRSQAELCPDGSVLVTPDRSSNVINPAAPVGAQPATAADYLDESLALCKVGKYRECVAAAEMALKLRPDYAEAYENICAAYNALEQWDQGIAACERALTLQPDLPSAKNNLKRAFEGKAASGK